MSGSSVASVASNTSNTSYASARSARSSLWSKLSSKLSSKYATPRARLSSSSSASSSSYSRGAGVNAGAVARKIEQYLESPAGVARSVRANTTPSTTPSSRSSHGTSSRSRRSSWNGTGVPTENQFRALFTANAPPASQEARAHAKARVALKTSLKNTSTLVKLVKPRTAPSAEIAALSPRDRADIGTLFQDALDVSQDRTDMLTSVRERLVTLQKLKKAWGYPRDLQTEADERLVATFIKAQAQFMKFVAAQWYAWKSSAAWKKGGRSRLSMWPLNMHAYLKAATTLNSKPIQILSPEVQQFFEAQYRAVNPIVARMPSFVLHHFPTKPWDLVKRPVPALSASAREAALVRFRDEDYRVSKAILNMSAYAEAFSGGEERRLHFVIASQYVADLQKYQKLLRAQYKAWSASAAWKGMGSSNLLAWPLSPLKDAPIRGNGPTTFPRHRVQHGNVQRFMNGVSVNFQSLKDIKNANNAALERIMLNDLNIKGGSEAVYAAIRKYKHMYGEAGYDRFARKFEKSVLGPRRHKA